MLTFLIHRLEELQEGYEEMIPYYRNWRKQHKDDIIRTEYERATTAVTETCRKSIGTKDLIRRLSAIVQGGRPRVRDIASYAYFLAAEKRTPETSE